MQFCSDINQYLQHQQWLGLVISSHQIIELQLASVGERIICFVLENLDYNWTA